MRILWRIALGWLVIHTLVAAQNDLTTKVDRYAKIMANKPPALAWKLTVRLKALGPKAVPPLKELLNQSSPTVRIAAAAALVYFGEERMGRDALLGMAGDVNLVPEARGMALRMLSSGPEPTLAAPLKALLTPTTLPGVQIETARALWQASLNDRPAARDVLTRLLASPDATIRSRSALVLAELGEIEVARDVLETLKDEPTVRAQLARSYLRNLDVQKQLGNAFQENAPFQQTHGKFDMLAEVMHDLRHYHLFGTIRPEEEWLEAAARGMLRSMDPHSTYFTSKQRAEWMFDLNKNYGGIGAFVNFDEHDVFTIIRPIYSGPAYRAGLRTDDKVLEVDGWETRDKDLNEIIKRLKGPAGTPVRIKVQRPGWKEPRVFSIKRARIKIKSARWEMLPGQIGYVELSNFGGETSHDLDEALNQLNRQGMQGLVLDLRNNQGGYLPTAIKVADKFLGEDKLIVYWQGRNKFIAPREEIRTTEALTQPDYPMVVLTNEHSASASEIVAGALQHYRRAKLVGKRTYGKGKRPADLAPPVTTRRRAARRASQERVV